MTSSTLFLLNLLMRVAHFWDILTSIFTDGTFKKLGWVKYGKTQTLTCHLKM